MKLLGKKWVVLILFPSIFVLGVVISRGWHAPADMYIAAVLFGLTLGLMAWFELMEFAPTRLLYINGAVGGVGLALIAYVWEKPTAVIILYTIGGILAGAASHFWLKHASF